MLGYVGRPAFRASQMAKIMVSNLMGERESHRRIGCAALYEATRDVTIPPRQGEDHGRTHPEHFANHWRPRAASGVEGRHCTVDRLVGEVALFDPVGLQKQ